MEDVKVLQLSTGVSVQNINELRKYIKALKEDLDDENASVEQNAATAEELRAAQAALRDAMYATTKSADDYIAASQTMLAENGELDGSYNDLVHTLADLKSAWRSTTDEAARADLGKEIDRVNSRLKELDASTGNFSRNVGNYTNSFKQAFGDLPPFLGPVKREVENVTKSLDLMGKQPVLSLLFLLTPVITKVTEALKDNETAQQALQRIMKALQPVAEALRAVIEKIAGWISVATDRVLEWAGENTSAFRTVIEGAAGVGNAILQFILTPIRETVSAVRGLGDVLRDVFTGQWGKIKEDATAAARGIEDAFRRGFDFKGNFAAGKEAGAAFIDGLSSTKDRARETGVGIGSALTEGIKEGMDLPQLITFTEEQLDRLLADFDAVTKARLAAEKEAAKAQAELDAEIADQEAALAAELDGIWEEYDAAQQERMDREIQRREALKTVITTYADATRSVLESVASTMEAEADGSEKIAQQVKNIRIAAATIDTISGAVAAYMNGIKTITIPSWAGIALGAAQAATVVAAGVAQIAKIRNTQVSRTGATAATSLSVPAATAAPSIPQTAQQTAITSMAYNTEQLNQRAADQRVYILQSDLEASGRQVAVREAESTF